MTQKDTKNDNRIPPKVDLLEHESKKTYFFYCYIVLNLLSVHCPVVRTFFMTSTTLENKETNKQSFERLMIWPQLENLVSLLDTE